MAPQPHWLLDVVRREWLALVTALALVVLAGANWIQDPQQAPRWLSVWQPYR